MDDSNSSNARGSVPPVSYSGPPISRSASTVSALSGSSKPCPGVPDRGCLTRIPLKRKRCRYCAKTMRLLAGEAE